jgi:small conductance mechanosensitive channel
MPKDLDQVGKLYEMLAAFVVTYSVQILASLGLLFIGWKIAGWVGRRIAAFAQKRGVEQTLANFMGDGVRIVALVLVIIITLGNFGVSIAPLIAAAGAAALGITVALQGPLANLAAGLVIIFTRPYVVGNTITVRKVSGVVEEVKLMATVLTDADGARVTIPNRQVVGEILVNSERTQLAETRVRVPFGADADKAIEVMRRTLAGIPGITQSPPPQVGVAELGDVGPLLSARYWVPNRSYFETHYKANEAILSAFKTANIPFQTLPTVTVGARTEQS